MVVPVPVLDRLGPAATAVLRYGLALLLLIWGGLKFARFEAEAIVPLISGSPLMSWMYSVFDVRTASALIGTTEVTLGLGMACRRVWPRLSGLASLGASATFLVTLSFLPTTPGRARSRQPRRRIPDQGSELVRRGVTHRCGGPHAEK